MKTVILAGLDNLVFSSADMLNPKQLKLVGFATTMEQAWNIYDENGNVKENIEEMPIMPVDAAVACEPDMMILASSNEEDDTTLKYMLCRADYRGEVNIWLRSVLAFIPSNAAAPDGPLIRPRVWMSALIIVSHGIF